MPNEEERQERREEREEAREARRLARLDAREKPLVRREKMKIGIKMERTEGCLYREAGDTGRLRKARRKQIDGEEAPDTVELTRGQLAMLSRKHAYCTPSVQCLADVLEHETSDEEEDAADRYVEHLRRKQLKRDRHERRKG